MRLAPSFYAKRPRCSLEGRRLGDGMRIASFTDVALLQLEDFMMKTRRLWLVPLTASLLMLFAGCTQEETSEGWQFDEDAGVDAGEDVWIPDDCGCAPPQPDAQPQPDANQPDASQPDTSAPDAAPPDASADAGPSCPDESDGYDYVSRDLDECARIFIACDDGQTPFQNQCGCGCVKDAAACQAQDIAGEGNCRMQLGWAFDGQRCVGVYGCDCEGDDCDDIFDDRTSCQAAYGECLGSGTCSPWDARGQGACEMVLGWTYDGQSCQAISGCSCEGDDCHRLTQSQETCRKTVGDCRSQCGDPDGLICDIYQSIDPADCPDGSVYTVIGCEPLCVDPTTCEEASGD